MNHKLNHKIFIEKTITFIKGLNDALPSTAKEKLLSSLNYTAEDLQLFFRGEKELTHIQFHKVACTFNFSTQAFSEGKVDLETVVKQYQGEEGHIPEKYQTKFGAKNFFYTISMEFIEQRLGLASRKGAQNYIQVLKTNEENLAHNILDDLNTYLDRLGFKEEDYFDLGYFATKRLLFKKLKTSKLEFPKLLKWFVEEVMPQDVENLNKYKVTKMEPGIVVFELSTNPGAVSTTTPKTSDDVNQCPKRMGGIKALMDFKEIKNGKFSHPKCRYKGDDKCVFSVNF